MSDSLFYKLHSGKPNKLLNLLSNFLGLLVPNACYRARRERKLRAAQSRPDYDYMLQRAAYYNRISTPWQVSPQDALRRERSWLYFTGTLYGFRLKTFHTAYYFATCAGTSVRAMSTSPPPYPPLSRAACSRQTTTTQWC